MPNFEAMRHTMVQCQVLPEGVKNPLLIEALLRIPRENFVPHPLASIAYMDANFPIFKGRVLLRPAFLACLLTACNFTPSDKVLYIACGTGYGPALLGAMGLHVIAVDAEDVLTQEAERILSDLQLMSVTVMLGPLDEGWKKEAPYDRIIIEGVVDFIPDALVSQLKEGGEIATLTQDKDLGSRAVKYVKKGKILIQTFLFGAYGPHLEAFQEKKSFVL